MISTVISSISRAAISPACQVIAQRNLSHTCAQSVQRLNDILEEYRAENYSREFPRRFRKDVAKAAVVNSPPRLDAPAVSAEGIEHVLRNIGTGDRMSRSEIDRIVGEVGARPVNGKGVSDCFISSDGMLDLISKNIG